MKNLIVNSLKKLRFFITKRYVVEKTMEHLENIRKAELNIVINDLHDKDQILEIGAGAGWQSEILQKNGYDVSAIDLENTNYKNEQKFNVISYDGYKIPFKDNSFDVVFSSNVLEHIPHIIEFQKEIKRVLKNDGVCIHLLPTANWVFWTNLTVMLKNFKFSSVHGEIAGSILTELHYFSKSYWNKLFLSTGWEIKKYKTNEIFYTGSSFMDNRLSIQKRKKLSKYLGASCHYYMLTKKKNPCVV